MRGFCVISSRNLDSHDRLVVRLRVSVSKRPHGLENAFAQGDGPAARVGLNELQEPGIAKLLPGRIGRFRKAVADHDEAIARSERSPVEQPVWRRSPPAASTNRAWARDEETTSGGR